MPRGKVGIREFRASGAGIQVDAMIATMRTTVEERIAGFEKASREKCAWRAGA